MEVNHEMWRFMRKRAEQLYEEGEVKRSLRLMRRINQEQAEAFHAGEQEERTEKSDKIVSTH